MVLPVAPSQPGVWGSVHSRREAGITACHLIGGSAPSRSLRRSQREGGPGGTWKDPGSRQSFSTHSIPPPLALISPGRSTDGFSLSLHECPESKCVWGEGAEAGLGWGTPRCQFFALSLQQILSDAERGSILSHLWLLIQCPRDRMTLLFPILLYFQKSPSVMMP